MLADHVLADHNSIPAGPTISVGQAVFTSSQASPGRGYHLVARSPKIRDALAGHLSRWGPAHGSLLAGAGDGSCLNFMPIDEQWTTVSRTVYGGPESSRRGAWQVVTIILALHHEQLAGYGNNPLTLAHTAMLLGYLRLATNWSSYRTDIELPAKSLEAIRSEKGRETGTAQGVSQLMQLLDSGERIALVAERSASATLENLFELTPFARRLQLSFTTGLKPSPDRRFRIHLLPFADRQLCHQLVSLGIHIVSTSA